MNNKICPETKKECVTGYCLEGVCSYREVNKHSTNPKKATAQQFIKEHFSEQAEDLVWFPVIVAIAEGYVNYLSKSTDDTKEYIDTVGNCANCGVEFHIHKTECKDQSGVSLIAQERREQIEKHGFSVEHDNYYKNKELVQAASFCLVLAESKIKLYNKGIPAYWPKDWGLHFMSKIVGKSKTGQLVVAGAFLKAENDRRGDSFWDKTIDLIAAEIDRLNDGEPIYVWVVERDWKGYFHPKRVLKSEADTVDIKQHKTEESCIKTIDKI